MKKRLGLFFFGIVALCFTSGCASMMSGTTQPVTFNSEPDGASVTVNGHVLGKTPTTLVIARKSDNIVEFSKEGYQKQSMKMDTKMNGWVIANVIWCLACPLSTSTDYSSGAAYEYSPNNYFVTLVQEGVTETPSDIKKRKVKSFIMGNYSNIITELSRKPGKSKGARSKQPSSSEYLTTLFTMLEIPEPDRQSARDKIKTISSNTKDVMMFSDKVVNAFIP